jgi:hypothetical protein
MRSSLGLNRRTQVRGAGVEKFQALRQRLVALYQTVQTFVDGHG